MSSQSHPEAIPSETRIVTMPKDLKILAQLVAEECRTPQTIPDLIKRFHPVNPRDVRAATWMLTGDEGVLDLGSHMKFSVRPDIDSFLITDPLPR